MLQTDLTVKFTVADEVIVGTLAVARYSVENQKALHFVDITNEESLGAVTVLAHNYSQADDEVFIINHFQNEDIIAVLIKAGIIHPPYDKFSTISNTINVCKLTTRVLDYFTLLDDKYIKENIIIDGCNIQELYILARLCAGSDVPPNKEKEVLDVKAAHPDLIHITDCQGEYSETCSNKHQHPSFGAVTSQKGCEIVGKMIASWKLPL